MRRERQKGAQMKVADWIRYNENVLRIDDVIVKVFRKKSFITDDMAIRTKIKFRDMAQIFGEYTIVFINFDKYQSDIGERTTLCFGIYYNEEQLK